MSMSRARSLVLILVLTSVFAAACHKKVVPQAPAPAPPAPPPAVTPAPPPPAPPPAPPAPAPAPWPLTDDEIFARKSVDQLNSEKPLTDVFFELDKSDLRDEGKASLQKDADWLRKWASTQVTVEGHCDSRGSAEYNLSLGSRRANAVKDYLVSLGVPTGRLTIVSKGKEQPFCAEQAESCWQQNRRGHFVITGK
jgi:peptidoglycan-associated lipoprotein